MAERSDIEWCDATYNPWEGCQKVGPGCDHCYAEERNNRFSAGANWGPGAPRRLTSEHTRNLLRRLNRKHDEWYAEHGRHRRVFCSSLCDIFDNAVAREWRDEAYAEIAHATDLDIMMLTKRIGNVTGMIPTGWHGGRWPRHVGLMITVVNQEEADRDIKKLIGLKFRLSIPWIGLSMEPLLGEVVIAPELLRQIDVVICGGESGPHARPMHPDWVRSLRDQCAAAGVPFFFKQWGEWLPAGQSTLGFGKVHGGTTVVPGRMKLHCGGSRKEPPHNAFADHGVEVTDIDNLLTFRVRKHAAGRLLDGVLHDAYPEAMR